MNPLEAVARFGSRNKAADALGIGRTKFRIDYKLAEFGAGLQSAAPPQTESNYNPKPRDYTKGPETIIPPVYVEKPYKPRMGVKGDGGSYKILAVGDIHDSPRLPDKSRLKWIARHAAATKPDKIVQIGDFGDFASCSTHEQPGSLGFAQKPSFRQDVESMEEALTAIYKEIGSDIPLLVCEGNHEFRVQRWEESHPALEGGFYQQLQDLWARFGWKSVRFGEWLWVGGVGFTHVPLTIIGKPYGGKASENQIANDALFSVVYGHTHRSAFKRAPKIGPAQSIQVLNLGSAMPQGYVAKYAGTATTGWSYGVFDLEIAGGQIIQHHEIPLSKLESLYAD